MKSHQPRRRFGQNFLHDRNVVDKIIAAIAPQSDDHFVEIGPGQGALTRPLLGRAGSLDVIEIDRDLAAAIRNELDDPKLTVHVDDALKFDFSRLGSEPGTLRLVGNLPYNISTPLLFHFLDHSKLFSDAHVMLQKEVVARMTAEPGSKTYGRLTVSLAARCRVEMLFVVKPGSFSPAPRVDSAVARIIPDPERGAGITDTHAFDRVVAAAFNQRRKRLGNALRGLLTDDQIASTGVDPGVRAETLGTDAYRKLANLHADTREPG